MRPGGAKRRWCGLLLCGHLAACAAPGEPTVINEFALGHVPASIAARPAATPARLASHVPAKLPVVAAVAPASRKVLAEPDRERPNTAVSSGETQSTTTVEPSPPDPSRAPKTTLPLVPVPPATAPAYSLLSPSANPITLMPPGKALVQTAHDASLAPGPALCSLDQGSTADDVILNVQPCPVDLRPTLRPGEAMP